MSPDAGNTSAKLVRAPGMEDVARLAEVSVQTVSRVLNNHPHVSMKTRARVTDAITALGYRRNTAARTLATSSSQILGIVNFGMSQLGQNEVIRAVQEAAQDSGYFVSLANVRNLSAESIISAFDSLLSQSVDGIVVIAPHYEAMTTIGDLPMRVPLVVVGARGRFDFISIGVDQSQAARLAAVHLLDLGHTRLVHISGPLDWLDAKIRLESWHRALHESGMEELPTLIGDWSAKSGFDRAQEVIREGEATALFVSSDQMALGALHALHRANVRVPHEISVVGLGDIEGAAFFEPALTTVRMDFSELGSQCMALIFDLMNGNQREAVVLQPALMVRSSTAPPSR